MAEKIYYDDNIFFLNEIISNIDDGIRLDIDTGLYLDKLVEDILFVESTLSRLYGSLQENNKLIRRSEHLRRLVRSKLKFSELLEDIVQHRVPLAENLVPFYPKFNELISEQQDHLAEIRNQLSASPGSADGSEDVVSQEEIRYLLMEGNSEESAQ
ncbi:MAG: hypothetical protein CMN78_00660 [Spirochaetales bacterium]|nr:hypothetical protein [Spirochaetales bacterium]